MREAICLLFEKQQKCHESQARQSTMSQGMCALCTKGGEKELC